MEDATTGGGRAPTAEDRDLEESDELVVAALAEGHHDVVREAIEQEAPGTDPVMAMLGALARRQEVHSDAAKVLGAMVGGLFGTGADTDDEMLLGLHDVGARIAHRLRSVETALVAASGAFAIVRDSR